jgi:hypothetical protein
MSRPSFEELVSLEPRLADLLAEAQAYHTKRPRGFCANAVFYGYPGHRPGLKKRLSELVGYTCGQEGVLGSWEAHDVAYRAIYQALPDCKHPEGECRPFAR